MIYYRSYNGKKKTKKTTPKVSELWPAFVFICLSTLLQIFFLKNTWFSLLKYVAGTNRNYTVELNPVLQAQGPWVP